MDKRSALAIYLVIFIIVFILARLYQINIWSSFVLALLIGLVVLFFLTPQNSFDKFKDNADLAGWLYIAIWGITFLIILFYILERIFRDRSTDSVEHKGRYNFIY